jgi:HlyD family secretion protein
MDIARPERKRKKRIRQMTLGAGGLLLLVLLTAGLTRLEPAAPSVARASVWVDTVKEGEMLREVRGTGTLVPHEIRWIAAQTDGRVERVVVRAGAEVTPDTVLVEMTNPDLAQQTETARYALEAAQAELTALKPKLRSQQLDERAALAAAQSDYKSAQLQAEAEKPLAEEGIVPDVQYQRSKLLVEQLATRVQIEQQRLDEFGALMKAQLGAQHAQVEQARNVYERRLAQVESLKVRAGLAGVLQQVLVESGQRVALGANIARVARPDDLQAELKIPETQARDVQLGQRVSVDTRNGVVEGRVARIDPAVQGGTVQVDVELTGPLPPGARPDLSVDGTIEIERLNHVVYTGRPAYGQSDSTISLFKLVDDGDYAVRVPVKVGRTSVNAVEIEQGLSPGDQVILSDTSQWDDQDRIRLN